MTFKNKFLFILLFIFFLQKNGKAQVSIVPELSASYLEKLIDTAKANYPKVKSYKNRINIANYNISKTKASWFETLTLSYVYQPGTTTIDPVNPSTSYFKGLQAGVFLNVGMLAEKPSMIKQAKQELLIAHNDQDEYMLNLATEVKKRYYAYIQHVAELKLQTKAVQDTEDALKDMKYKFQKGEETFEDYNKAQNDATNHQILKIQAEASLFAAKADIEELLGTKLENIK